MRNKFSKIIFLFILISILIFSITILPVSAAPKVKAPFKGSGTEANPYLISTAAQLSTLSSFVNNKVSSYGTSYYRMINDIDVSSILNWISIGNTYDTGFYGNFDGNGFSIYGLTININVVGTTNLSYGFIGNNFGIVRNLGVINGSITVLGDHPEYGPTGAIAGVNHPYALIENCRSSNIIKTNRWYTGGVVGYNGNAGSIRRSTNSSTVTGYSHYVGGIAGISGNQSSIIECFNAGSISGGEYEVGGIVGYIGYGQLSSCINTGSVYGLSGGGIAGYAGSYSELSNCYNVGQINGAYYSGGIVGYNNSSKISSSYNVGIISGNSIYGEIVGFNNSESIVLDVYFSGDTGIGVDESLLSQTFRLSLTEMQDQANFVGFDFSNYWIMPTSNTNYKYPVLKSNYGPCDVIKLISPSTTDYLWSPNNTHLNIFVPISQKKISINLLVSPGATWQLYSDELLTNPIPTSFLVKQYSSKTIYIKVNALNGGLFKVYSMKIVQ